MIVGSVQCTMHGLKASGPSGGLCEMAFDNIDNVRLLPYADPRFGRRPSARRRIIEIKQFHNHAHKPITIKKLFEKLENDNVVCVSAEEESPRPQT